MAASDDKKPDGDNIFMGRSDYGPQKIIVPPGKGSKAFWKTVVRDQFLISIIGLYSGLACLLIGILLFLNGVLGGGHWMVDAFGITISDAAPGSVMFLIGLGMAQVTQFTVTINRSSADPNVIGGIAVVGRNLFGKFGIEVPSEGVDEEFWTMVLKYQFYYSIAGFGAGWASIVGGLFMILSGFVGTSHWSVNMFGIEIHNAAPGTVLLFLGLGFLYVTQFTVKIGDPRRPGPNPGPLPPAK